MTQPKKFVSVVLAFFAVTLFSHGQTTHPASKAAGPVSMTECKGTNNCATWTFLGTQRNGKWPTGEEANLSVEKFDSVSVVIRRADSTGREWRRIAVGYLDGRLHILCYLPRAHGIRVISFRKANEKEARRYGKPKTIDE